MSLLNDVSSFALFSVVLLLSLMLKECRLRVFLPRMSFLARDFDRVSPRMSSDERSRVSGSASHSSLLCSGWGSREEQPLVDSEWVSSSPAGKIERNEPAGKQGDLLQERLPFMVKMGTSLAIVGNRVVVGCEMAAGDPVIAFPVGKKSKSHVNKV